MAPDRTKQNEERDYVYHVTHTGATEFVTTAIGAPSESDKPHNYLAVLLFESGLTTGTWSKWCSFVPNCTLLRVPDPVPAQPSLDAEGLYG